MKRCRKSKMNIFLTSLAKENIVLLILLLTYRSDEKIVVQLVMLMVISQSGSAKRIVSISEVCQSFEIIKACSLRFEARRRYQRALISRSLDSRSTSTQYSFHGKHRIRSINFVTSVCYLSKIILKTKVLDTTHNSTLKCTKIFK